MTRYEKMKQAQVQVCEMLDDLKRTAQKKVEAALSSGAIDDDSSFMDDNYLLSKAVLSIVFESQPYLTGSLDKSEDYQNLRNFI